ncbi:MAG: CBS domain-containing protein [Nanoarchaeota archaeon]
MKIKEAMHNVTKVLSTTNIAEAAKIMDQKVIGSVLVEEEDQVIGIVTERDILRKVVAAGKRCEDTTVKDIMNELLITIGSEATLEEASDTMRNNKIRRIVVKDGGEIVGIVTARDLAERIKYSLSSKILRNRDSSSLRPDY